MILREIKRLGFSQWIGAKQMHLFALGIFMSFFVSQSASAQDGQFWGEFRPGYMWNDKWVGQFAVGYRQFYGSQEWHRYYIHPMMRYNLNKRWNIRAGLNTIYNTYQTEQNHLEIRPYLGVGLKWPIIEWMDVNHYARVEERISRYSEEAATELVTRGRYKVDTRIPLWRISKENLYFLMAYGELFFNMGGEADEVFRNRNRFGAGVGMVSKSKWSYTLLFNYQKTRQATDGEFDRHDFFTQIRIAYTWKKKTKE